MDMWWNIFMTIMKKRNLSINRELGEKLNFFRDLIAYRIVISMPKCHVKDSERAGKAGGNQILYEIANVLKDFLEERGFRAEPAGGVKKSTSELLREEVRPYYRDYITNVDPDGYCSLHITFLITVQNAIWRCSFGRNKWMISQKLVRQII